MAIDRFELPRDDWYDSQGRIYKDALIENFNALEEKMLQIQSLDTIEVEAADFESISLNDVTLADNDNKVINLKSLVSILGLTYYPIECITSGKTIVKYSFYDSNYDLQTLEDVKLDNLSDDVPFAVYNLDSNNLMAVSSLNNNSHVLIGTFRGGSIDHVLSKGMCDINILEPLSKMPVRWRSGYTNRKEDVIFYLTDPTRNICYAIHAKHGRKGGGQTGCFVDQGEPGFADNYYAKTGISGKTNRKGL